MALEIMGGGCDLSQGESEHEEKGGWGPARDSPISWLGSRLLSPRGLDSHTKSGRKESTQGRKGSSSGPRRGKAW